MIRMIFDAISEPHAGAKWHSRWQRSWPAYEAWFLARGGDNGPDRKTCRAALARYMPELLPTYDRLVTLAGGSDRAARFLSTWCPPAYLGGCSIAALSDGAEVRLVRNYDLSPDLNEGFLLRSAWTGRPVMGMVEFLWGLSDGINDAGLAVALAYGGRSETGRGFGVTTILRYVLETCDTVDEAVEVLARVPSHMAYNIVLTDLAGNTASVELSPGGGARRMQQAIATNHQSSAPRPDQASFTRTYERHEHLRGLTGAPALLYQHFLKHPLRQDRFEVGFGTLFTTEYDPATTSLRLIWPDMEWRQSLYSFEEGQRIVALATPALVRSSADAALGAHKQDWALASRIDWLAVGRDYAAGRGKEIASYLENVSTQS